MSGFGEANGYAYVTFDTDAQVRAATEDPTGFIERLGPRAVLDAVQRAPGLFPVLRVLIDRDRRPGRFLLLGIDTQESLLAHPVVGASWEGLVVEHVARWGQPLHFWRTQAGAAIDLVVEVEGQR